MKSHLNFIPTGEMSQDDWLSYRLNGLGASDIATVLGLNPWKSSIELFYERVNGVKYNIENMAMFLGKEQESFIADLWQYWETSNENMIVNYRQDRVVRKCQRVNAYVSNPAYPWLFVSLDRKINKTATKGEGALEIKTISGYEADKWEAGIPPAYIMQIQTQMLVCEFDFAELAVMKDGRNFEVYPFIKNESIQAGIIERTKLFWDKVTQARIIMSQRYEAQQNFNMRLVNECDEKLDKLEPEPDGSLSYEGYLKERYKKSSEAGVILGTDADYELALEHLILNENKAALEERIREKSNRLKNRIGTMQTIDFGTKGKVSWKGDPIRRFYNNIKN